MKIINLSEEFKPSYFVCLENWSDEITEAALAKEKWYEKMKGQGLRVKLAQDDSGIVRGLIQYFPIEHSWVEGKDLYFISCIFVYGNNGVTYRNQGMGKAMLKVAEADAKELGAKGMVAWGSSLPVWMKASWYKKQGYVPADSKGFLGDVLLWKPFTDDAQPPKWNRQNKKPEKNTEKVIITCRSHGWCTAQNLACQRAKSVAAEFGNQVEVHEIDSLNEAQIRNWDLSDTLNIGGDKVSTGPPPSKEKLKKLIEKKVRKLK